MALGRAVGDATGEMVCVTVDAGDAIGESVMLFEKTVGVENTEALDEKVPRNDAAEGLCVAVGKVANALEEGVGKDAKAEGDARAEIVVGNDARAEGDAHAEAVGELILSVK